LLTYSIYIPGAHCARLPWTPTPYIYIDGARRPGGADEPYRELLIMGLTAFGVFHTVISLLAVVAGVTAFVK
jgi:hypothetical protein